VETWFLEMADDEGGEAPSFSLHGVAYDLCCDAKLR
jgi:hypothetical protein